MISLAASCTSHMERSSRPETVNKTPLAPSAETSRSGEWIARRAASWARFRPEAKPIPMMAEPEFKRTVLTSAKSTLIMPGVIIKSAIPSTAWLKTSSHIAKAARKGVSRSTVFSKRSLGITIMASTALRSLTRPSSAILLRISPSKAKGLVTMATVSAP